MCVVYGTPVYLSIEAAHLPFRSDRRSDYTGKLIHKDLDELKRSGAIHLPPTT